MPDLNRSKRWYAELLGWQEVMTGADADSGVTVGAMSGGFLLGLRQHSANSGDRFDTRRTGLDHAALAVAIPEELSGWEQRLAASRVTYSPTVSAPYWHVLSFKDPDGIALEFFVPRAQPRSALPPMSATA